LTTRTTEPTAGLSEEEALAVPVTFDVWPTLGRALGIGRTTTYQLARTNQLPIPVLRVGRQLRARRRDLLAFLGLNEISDGVEDKLPGHLDAVDRVTSQQG
jgi:hypothetical protein